MTQLSVCKTERLGALCVQTQTASSQLVEKSIWKSLGNCFGAIFLLIYPEGLGDSLSAWGRSGRVQAGLLLTSAPPQSFWKIPKKLGAIVEWRASFLKELELMTGMHGPALCLRASLLSGVN